MDPSGALPGSGGGGNGVGDDSGMGLELFNIFQDAAAFAEDDGGRIPAHSVGFLPGSGAMLSRQPGHGFLMDTDPEPASDFQVFMPPQSLQSTHPFVGVGAIQQPPPSHLQQQHQQPVSPHHQRHPHDMGFPTAPLAAPFAPDPQQYPSLGGGPMFSSFGPHQQHQHQQQQSQYQQHSQQQQPQQQPQHQLLPAHLQAHSVRQGFPGWEETRSVRSGRSHGGTKRKTGDTILSDDGFSYASSTTAAGEAALLEDADDLSQDEPRSKTFKAHSLSNAALDAHLGSGGGATGLSRRAANRSGGTGRLAGSPGSVDAREAAPAAIAAGRPVRRSRTRATSSRASASQAMEGNEGQTQSETSPRPRSRSNSQHSLAPQPQPQSRQPPPSPPGHSTGSAVSQLFQPSAQQLSLQRQLHQLQQQSADDDADMAVDDPEAGHGGQVGDSASEKLARKAELARASRRRKKLYVLNLEERNRLLSGLVEELQRQLAAAQARAEDCDNCSSRAQASVAAPAGTDPSPAPGSNAASLSSSSPTPSASTSSLRRTAPDQLCGGAKSGGGIPAESPSAAASSPPPPSSLQPPENPRLRVIRQELHMLLEQSNGGADLHTLYQLERAESQRARNLGSLLDGLKAYASRPEDLKNPGGGAAAVAPSAAPSAAPPADLGVPPSGQRRNPIHASRQSRGTLLGNRAGSDNTSATKLVQARVADLCGQWLDVTSGDRRRSLQGLDRALQSLRPQPQLKFLLWALDQPESFYRQPGEWLRSLAVGTGLTQDQLASIARTRHRIRDQRRKLSDTNHRLGELRHQLELDLQALDEQVDSVVEQVNPIQMARYLAWVDKNQFVLEMLDVNNTHDGSSGAPASSPPEAATAAAAGGGCGDALVDGEGSSQAAAAATEPGGRRNRRLSTRR